ncbi:hypothetical protein DIE19_03000 [Burkholderia sp. Bp9126]|nr:hypothetical protein DIE19_03000 [Burkholderia sp. Bp9126]
MHRELNQPMGGNEMPRFGGIATHVDAHADVNDTMFGEKIAHGTPFRRAVEDGLLQCDKVTQIGLRGTGYHADDFDWCREQGFTVVQAEECWNRSLAALMAQVRVAFEMLCVMPGVAYR